ncbi:MAG TPA: histidine kinase [Polyangia bacterium]|nr:histidine kinase [Polyangia bacterium]
MDHIPPSSILRRTWRALLEPRRLAAVVLVSAALLLAQANFGGDPLAIPLGAAMCLAFVLVAPVSWRVLFPYGPQRGQLAVRLTLFAAVGTAVVLVVAMVAPEVLGMEPTLLTLREGKIISLALFLVGGWGLARDIDFDDRLRAAEDRAAESARAAERAELLALRAHLDPHFLFNTLNAIAEWCRQDGQVAERAVLELSSMLRAILAGVRAPAWPLRAELELVRALFGLYGLRDAALYQLEERMPDPLPNVTIPPLLLLPLAENAIKHGPAAGHRGPVILAISVDSAAGRLALSISNHGPWNGERPGGEGLRMVSKRIELAYAAGEATLTAGAVEDLTVVELTLPLHGPRLETPA